MPPVPPKAGLPCLSVGSHVWYGMSSPTLAGVVCQGLAAGRTPPSPCPSTRPTTCPTPYPQFLDSRTYEMVRDLHIAQYILSNELVSQVRTAVTTGAASITNKQQQEQRTLNSKATKT